MIQAALIEYEEDEVQSEVLRILEPGNEFLYDLVDQFGKTRTQPNKAQVVCFYELKPSNVGAIVGGRARTVCWACLTCFYIELTGVIRDS